MSAALKLAPAERPPLSALAKTILILNLVPIPWYIAFQFLVLKAPFPPIGITNAIASLIVVYVTTRRRKWSPLAAIIWGVVGTLSEITMVGSHLKNPGDWNNLLNVLMFVGFLLTFAAGVAAQIQSLRADHATPRWLSGAAIGIFSFLLGAALVAVIYRPGATTVPEHVMQTLPTLTAEHGMFKEPEIRVKAGQPVTLRLRNLDLGDHSFDIDELNVHVHMPGTADALSVFTPEKPGTYAVYCGIPGHTAEGHTKGMVTKLIVSVQ